MSTYVYRAGKVVNKQTGEPIRTGHVVASPGYAMPDITPFTSPIDRSEISSRSQLREHEKRHGVKQIGNDFNSTYRKMADQHREA